MKKTHQNKFSTWTLWSPLKFALISFCILVSTAFIYSLIASMFYTPSTMPQSPLAILLALGFLGAMALQIRSLPRTKMDRTSFISIHNIQTLILSVLFITSSFLIVRHAQQIMFHLLMMETQLSGAFILTISASLLFYLYLTGLLLANFYAKFQRIREFKIPTWKIICSIPFGFSALWAPGYILDSDDTKKPSFVPKSAILQRVSNWIISRPANTIATFILITIISGFFFGFNAVLLTFSLTLIFGIWTLQVGKKSFAKNMQNRYATTVAIFNIVLLILFIGFYAIVPTTTQNVQITISDTQITEPLQ